MLQTGKVTIEEGMRPTPYMRTNHMIAAGVTGTCTTQWFGNDSCTGAPTPSVQVCTLAQIDLFFNDDTIAPAPA